jgi:hypothetical protein
VVVKKRTEKPPGYWLGGFSCTHAVIPRGPTSRRGERCLALSSRFFRSVMDRMDDLLTPAQAGCSF